MYIININIDNNLVKKIDISDKYQVHQFVYSLFPNRKDDRILYRNEQTRILVMTSLAPNFDRLQQCDFMVKSFDTFFNIGSKFKFDILLNPTIKTRKYKNPIGIIDHDMFLDWFNYQSEKNGFKTTDIFNFYYNLEKIRKPGGQKYSIVSTKLKGIIEVIDGKKFENLLMEGLGDSKYLGYGMFCIARV